MDIEVGAAYAWLPPTHPIVEPVRAVVVQDAAAALGMHRRWDTVKEFHPGTEGPAWFADLYHPDDGLILAVVAECDLYGLWHERALLPSADEGRASFDPKKTWAEVAEERYAYVTAQREVTSRLTALGIERADMHYAGRGGTARAPRQVDAGLHLSGEEWQRLLSLAERGNT